MLPSGERCLARGSAMSPACAIRTRPASRHVSRSSKCVLLPHWQVQVTVSALKLTDFRPLVCMCCQGGDKGFAVKISSPLSRTAHPLNGGLSREGQEGMIRAQCGFPISACQAVRVPFGSRWAARKVACTEPGQPAGSSSMTANRFEAGGNQTRKQCPAAESSDWG